MVMIQRKIPYPLHSVGWLVYPAAPVRGNLSALFAVKVPLHSDARPMRVGFYTYYPRCQSRLSLSSPLFTAAWGWVSTLSKLGDDMLELL